jgi:hypothetical protein
MISSCGPLHGNGNWSVLQFVVVCKLWHWWYKKLQAFWVPVSIFCAPSLCQISPLYVYCAHNCKYVFMWLFARLSQTSVWCIYCFPVYDPCSYYEMWNAAEMKHLWWEVPQELFEVVRMCDSFPYSLQRQGKELFRCCVYSEIKLYN